MRSIPSGSLINLLGAALLCISYRRALMSRSSALLSRDSMTRSGVCQSFKQEGLFTSRKKGSLGTHHAKFTTLVASGLAQHNSVHMELAVWASHIL